MKEPKVSIIMSVYNGEDHVRFAINSILNQTYANFEFIIIDDGSTDNTVNIIEEYRENDSRIKLVKNNDNIGLAKSLNFGIKKSVGKYIARQDSDDISHPSRLETQIKYFTKNKEIDILGCNSHLIDQNGNIFSSLSSFSGDLVYTLLKKNTLFAHGTVIIKRDVFDKIGMYNPSFYYSQDMEFWMRCAIYNIKIDCLPIKLYSYRVTASSKDEQKLKVILRTKINEILNISFKSAINTQNWVVDNKRISEIIDEYQYKRSFITDESNDEYWYKIAKAAFRNKRKPTYIRSCLKKSIKHKLLNPLILPKLVLYIFTIFYQHLENTDYN